jgi:hypothetical protein
MKTSSMTLLTSALLSLSSIVGAEACSKIEITNCDNENTHRVYAGPEFFWSHFKGGLDKNALGVDLTYTRNVYYGGLRFGYEYLRPQGFYAATDAIAALGSTKQHIQDEKAELVADKDITAHARETLKGHKGHLWTNIEQRLGYTFSSSKAPNCNLTVFAGPGFHYEHTKGSKASWWYAAAGLKFLQQFSDHFFIGCDFKTMYAFEARDQNGLILPTTTGEKDFWGYEVSVPFEWKLGMSQTFDVQLRPYLLKLNLNSPETILGTTLAFGYNF